MSCVIFQFNDAWLIFRQWVLSELCFRKAFIEFCLRKIIREIESGSFGWASKTFQELWKLFKSFKSFLRNYLNLILFCESIRKTWWLILEKIGIYKFQKLFSNFYGNSLNFSHFWGSLKIYQQTGFVNWSFKDNLIFMLSIVHLWDLCLIWNFFREFNHSFTLLFCYLGNQGHHYTVLKKVFLDYWIGSDQWSQNVFWMWIFFKFWVTRFVTLVKGILYFCHSGDNDAFMIEMLSLMWDRRMS